MRPRRRVLLFAAALVALQGGCGTIVNLTSPPPSRAMGGIGPTACTPFGGVTRSGMLGGFLVAWGLVSGWDEVGQGGLLMGAGLAGVGTVALLDAPLSLAGDILTLPVAYARQQGAGWATWWGDQGHEKSPSPVPQEGQGGSEGPAPPEASSPGQAGQPAANAALPPPPPKR
jgi:uncharacterized protein YceK